MAEPEDLEKRRQSIRQRLDELSKEIEHQSESSKLLTEFTSLLYQLIDGLEARAGLHAADLLVFQKIILGAARLSKNWEEFQEKCLQAEKSINE